MRLREASPWVLWSGLPLLAIFGGCGPGDPGGTTLQGDIVADRSSGSLTGTTGFHFEPRTVLVPPEIWAADYGAFAGGCLVTGDETRADLDLEIGRPGAQDAGLRSIHLTSTFTAGGGSGTLVANVGGSDFSGTCTAAWQTSGTGPVRDLGLQFACPLMTMAMAGQPDRLAVQATIAVFGCAVAP